MTLARKLISFVVPVYNEEENVEALYQAVNRVMEQLADRYDYEFVFTDNHSTDKTFAILERLARLDERVRCWRFSRNFGYQRSILTGYLLARGDAAMQLDCDLQDPPELIPDFVGQWELGHHVVYGVRRSRKESLLVHSARRMFYRLIDLLSEDKLPHDAGDFRLVDRRILDELRRLDDAQPYLRGAIASMGFAQVGIPYDRNDRRAGQSKFAVRDLFRLAFDGILNHSTVPLRFATYTGLVTSAITFLGLAFFTIAKLWFGREWPAGFATTTVLILLSLSLNALFLGVIGEYLGRIYQQVKRRPLTILEQQLDPYEQSEHRPR